MKRNQSGSALVIVLVVILVVGLAGFGIWRYLDNKNASVAQPTPTPSPSPTQPTPEPTTPQPTAPTLDIKELGIRVTLPSYLTDLTYAIETGETVDGKEVLRAKLSSKSLEKADKNCTAKWNPYGVLSRIEGEYPEQPNAENTGGRLVKQFDGFHIDYSGPQATCTEDNNVQDKITEILNKISESTWVVEELS